MHPSTFEYLEPTDEQLRVIAILRTEAANFEIVLDANIPNGPDKTYLLRKFREVWMWANVAITRNPDGSPRS